MTPATAKRPVHAPSTEEKSAAKAAFQRQCGFAVEPKRPLLCVPMSIAAQTGGALLAETLPGMIDVGLTIALIGKGSKEYGAMLTAIAAKQPEQVVIIPDQTSAIEAMLRAADMAVFTSAPEEDALRACLRNAVVPISPSHALLQNYNPNQETGNSFLYKHASVWHVFAAIVRACETYSFPYDWRTICDHATESVEG